MISLVIVESPTKARTLQKFLGDKFQIEASMGHVRDLPKADFGVDIGHNFEPNYIIPADKRKTVTHLKKMAQGAQTLYLATDPDREGEAIAWHIAELLRNSNLKRVVFHEITEEAIKDAFLHPRDIDLQLVDAQQARRILDRLVGYKLSPLLWQKVKKGSSAGRVQSVVLRLIVEREREVKAFKAEEYWSIEATLQCRPRPDRGPINNDKLLDPRLRGDDSFTAMLIEQNGKKLEIKNKEQSDEHVKNLEQASYNVAKVTQKEVRRFPYPPFTTSTLQQGAANRLGMSAKKTMMLAQGLYERGLITYMRTDSVNLSVQAIGQVRAYIENFIGKTYLPKTARIFKSKSKNAQEAHEAIRPTEARVKGEAIKEKDGLNRDHVRLYDLIWKRFVSCQMSEAVMDQTTVDVAASSRHPERSEGSLTNPDLIGANVSSNKLRPARPAGGDSSASPQNDNTYLFRATGSIVKFEGWLKLYGKDLEEKPDEKNQVLPKLSENQLLNLIQLLPNQHFTEPPPRYNEASLIKKLEELGIGRPSTYAPILSTIQDRFYVEKIERKFIPTQLGFAVCDFLVGYFPDIFDYQFTAQMEDELDEISRGERQWQPTLQQFYTPFEKKLEEVERVAEKVKMEVQLAGKKCPECGKELIVRIGRFGKFLACSGFPDCKYTESIEEKVDAKCPLDGGEILVRKTRKGKTFYGCKNWPVCKFASWTKPKSANPEPVIASEAKQS